MFRSICVRRSPASVLGQPKPPLASSLKHYQVVRRFAGPRSTQPLNLLTLNSVVEKTKGSGVAGVAAIIGRAAVYLEAHNPSAAIAEIQTVMDKVQDEELRRLAIGLRLIALNNLLDLKEDSLSVTGGASESEVSTLRTQVRATFDELAAHSTGCWLVSLGAAEYTLYEGKNSEALAQLEDVETNIKAYLATGTKVDNPVVATTENFPAHSLVAFNATRLAVMRTSYKVADKTIEATLNSSMRNSTLKADVEALRMQLAAELTDDEVIQVAHVLEAATIRHHFQNYFPRAERYRRWDSEAATAAQNVIQDLCKPPCHGLLTDDILATVKSAKPSQPFYVPQEELRKLVTTLPKDKNILSELRTKFGPGPTTAVAVQDTVFISALKAAESSHCGSECPSTPQFASAQRNMARELAQQILYRTQVGIALSLIELDRLSEAIDKLSAVITEDRFVLMWRALLARSRAYKALGKVSEANSDMQLLEKYKPSITG